MKCLNCGEEHLIEGYDFCCQACELEHNAGEIDVLESKPVMWRGKIREFKHTYKLKSAEIQTRMYGVSIHALAGSVTTWWNVPRKYRATVHSSGQCEFVDFMAETGLTSAELVFDSNDYGKCRVFFNLKADWTKMKEYLDMSHRNEIDIESRVNEIADLRREALNDAANQVRYIKGKFQDYIRKLYYAERLAD